MAGQIDRAVGQFGELTISGTNYAARIANAELNEDIAVRENKAINDAWRYPKELDRGWEISFTLANETDDTNLGVLNRMTGSGNPEVAVVFRPYKESGNPVLTGNGILTRGSVAASDVGTSAFTITGQGVLNQNA